MKQHKKTVYSVTVLIVLILLAITVFCRDSAALAKEGGTLPAEIAVTDTTRAQRAIGVGEQGTLNLRGTPLTSGVVPVMDVWNLSGAAIAEHQSYIRMQSSDGSGPYSVYCMDYGKSANSGTVMTGRDMAEIGEEKKKQLVECLSFGYTEQTAAPTAAQKAKYAATQAMLWNVMAGLYPSETGDRSAETYLAYVEQPDTAVKFYYELKHNMMTYEQAPAFTSKNLAEAPEYKLKWNAVNKRFETILEDKDGVASKSAFELPEGVQMDISGSKVTIFAEQCLKDVRQIQGRRSDLTLKNCTMYWNDRNDTQRFGVCDLAHAIEAEPFFFKISTEKARIDLTKVDSETGKTFPQGAAKEFAGTIYDLFGADYKESDNKDSPSYVTSLTLDKEGKATVGDLAIAVYYLKEREAPQGYLRDERVYKVTFPATDGITPVHAAVTSKEDVVRGDVEVMKFGQDKPSEDNEIKRPLEGIEFTFTSLTTGDTYVIRTDKTGYASTGQLGNKRGGLPYDTYRMEETKGKEGYKIMEPVELTIKEEHQILRYIIEDKEVRAALQIQKADAETGKIIPVAGTTFRILDEKGKQVVMYTYYPKKEKHKTFRTDETGMLTLPEPLSYGTYTLEEVNAPAGYLKAEPIPFEVTKTTDYEKPLTIICKDTNAKGKIQLKKVDEDTKEPLNGVTFEIRAKEDIVTPDGTVRVQKDELLDMVTTDEEGDAVSKELYFGTYLVKEVDCKDGYQMKDTADEVQLTYKDQDTPLVIYPLEITNKKIIPDTPKKEQIAPTPKTGDKTDVSILTLFVFLSCFLLLQCAKISHRDY